MQAFKIVNKDVFIIWGENATLKGMDKQLKMARSMTRRSHLDLKASFGLNI